MVVWVFIAMGGALGAVVRFALYNYIGSATSSFAVTFLVNCIGCLLIGVIAAYFEVQQDKSEIWRLFWIVGVLGAFTTFSAFSMDVLRFILEGQWLLAVVYVVGTLLSCIAVTSVAFRFFTRVFA